MNWLPGSDRLRGRCHCGAETEAEDPVEMWEWLLAHPDHPSGGAPAPGRRRSRRSRRRTSSPIPAQIRERTPVLA